MAYQDLMNEFDTDSSCTYFLRAATRIIVDVREALIGVQRKPRHTLDVLGQLACLAALVEEFPKTAKTRVLSERELAAWRKLYELWLTNCDQIIRQKNHDPDNLRAMAAALFARLEKHAGGVPFFRMSGDVISNPYLEWTGKKDE